MLGGALVPGKPVANMYFTLYGYNSVVQSYTLLKDLKLVRHTFSLHVMLDPTYVFRANIQSCHPESLLLYSRLVRSLCVYSYRELDHISLIFHVRVVFSTSS